MNQTEASYLLHAMKLFAELDRLGRAGKADGAFFKAQAAQMNAALKQAVGVSYDDLCKLAK